MFVIEYRSDESLHHQIEFAWFGQVMAAAVGACIGVVHEVDAEAGLAVAAVDHQIAELVEVSGSLPHSRVAYNGGIESFDIVACFDHFVPPELFDSAFHAASVRAVVPETVDPAVDFRAWEYEASAFAEGNNLVHQILIFDFVSHDNAPCLSYF